MTDLESKLKLLEAECLQMREALKNIADPFPGRPHEGANWPDLWRIMGNVAHVALQLPRTARLARKIELMEEVIKRYRNARCFTIGVDEALAALDAHEAGSGE